MELNTTTASSGRALHLALLEASDRTAVIPYGSADKSNTLCLEGLRADDGTKVTVTIEGSPTEYVFTQTENGLFLTLGTLPYEDGAIKLTLTVTRRGRDTRTATFSLNVVSARLSAPDSQGPEVLAALVSELARLRSINRKTQKRLRAIERSLGNCAWI